MNVWKASWWRGLLMVVLATGTAWAQVRVLHKEGLVHGFLTLRSTDGELLANGDLIQNVVGERVSSRLIFHFKDGSLHDETAVFSQRRTFHLVSDHLIQKGPSFEHPVDVTVDGGGKVIVRYEEDGKLKVDTEQMKVQAPLANGFLLTLIKNLDPKVQQTKLAMVVATPKPRLVTLVVNREGEDSFRTGSEERKATLYRVKFDIGGFTGVLAELLKKTPPDLQIWTLGGEAPAFVKSEGPLAPGGPVWRIELVSPVWGDVRRHE